MDPYRDANAPPPPYPHDGSPLPPYVPPHGAKFHEDQANVGGYQAYPGGYPPPQQHQQHQGYPPPQMYQQQGYQPPPQQQQYQPQPPPRQTATVVVAPSSVGQNPMRIRCPSCQADIKSRVRRSNALKTHFVAILLCLLCCWPCICVPYCMASCKDATHSCPNCKAFLGTYRA